LPWKRFFEKFGKYRFACLWDYMIRDMEYDKNFISGGVDVLIGTQIS
jgi:hypothetical protein